MRDTLLAWSDATAKAPLVPGARFESARLVGWQKKQRLIREAARALGFQDLGPGEHSPDGEVTVGLWPRGGEIVVFAANRPVGVIDEESVSRVRTKLKAHGKAWGGEWVGRCEARLYHFEHGRWGFVLDV